MVLSLPERFVLKISVCDALVVLAVLLENGPHLFLRNIVLAIVILVKVKVLVQLLGLPQVTLNPH